MDGLQIKLWIFPPEDFTAWCELVGDPQVADYTGYLTLLAAVQADQEHSGREVVRVKMTVAEMLASLAERGLENTPDNRALITALRI